MNRYLIWAMFLWLPLNLLGKTNFDLTGDSLNYLTPQDTIFLSTGLYGQKVFVHEMEPNQTLYSLSKFYGLTLDELYYYNPENEGGKYGIGSKIKVPVPNRSIIRFKPKNYDGSSYVPLYYVVKKGETMYHVAQRIFKMPIDTLMDRNKMIGYELSIGQKLRIGWMSIEGIPDGHRQFKGHPMWQKSYAYKMKYALQKRHKKEYNRKGPAVYIEGTKSTSDLFVMHKHAPIGSIIQVNNPMKRRTVYAKVIARTPASYDSNVEIVVSPRVGKMLGARDRKFYVKTKYLR